MAKVLVVDDDEAIREMLVDVLEDEDFEVITLKDSKSIDQHLAQLQPACLLLDVILPSENGDQVTKKLKADNKFKNIPIMLMSANTDLDKLAESCHADATIAKPFQTSNLIETVRQYCSNQPHSHTAITNS